METLYVRNLNEKVGLQKLRAELIDIFAKFGTVSSIQARKTLRMKGQAFVSFELAANAEAARTTLNGQTFLGKPLDIQFAKNKSRTIAMEDRGSIDSTPLEHTNEHQRSSKRSSESFHTSQSKRLKSTARPNKILFVEDLPESISFDKFSNAFSELPGFVEARLVAARKVGFVEFLTVDDATVAMKSPILFDTKSVRVSFAKH